jgi:dsDNA-binding SOS-regulon protein
MARNWIDDLERVNRNTNVKEGDPIPAANILQAMDDADIPKEEQAKILGMFMEVNKDTLDGAAPDKPAATDKPETTLTLQQIVAMAQDPSKRAELQAIWAAMPEDKKQEFFAQIEALKPEAAAKAPDVDTQKLVQPVLNVMQAVQTIATSSTPKRTKMLDVIQEINKVLPSPAMGMKDDKGVTYAQSLINMLNSHADKFGTTATPGDKFVKLINASIQQNKPIELPQTALEARIIELSQALTHR